MARIATKYAEKKLLLRTPEIALSPSASASMVGELHGEWHPRLRYNFRGEANFQETEGLFFHVSHLIYVG